MKIPKDGKSYQMLAVAAELVGTVMGSAIIGNLIDKHFNKGGLITFVFILLGFVAYVVRLIKRSKE